MATIEYKYRAYDNKEEDMLYSENESEEFVLSSDLHGHPVIQVREIIDENENIEYRTLDNIMRFCGLHDGNMRSLYVGDIVEISIDLFFNDCFVTKTYKAEIKENRLGCYFHINEDLQYYFNECITDEESQLTYLGNIYQGEK